MWNLSTSGGLESFASTLAAIQRGSPLEKPWRGSGGRPLLVVNRRNEVPLFAVGGKSGGAATSTRETYLNAIAPPLNESATMVVQYFPGWANDAGKVAYSYW